MQTFNLKKLIVMEGKEEYHIKISNRSAALIMWTSIRLGKEFFENIKFSAILCYYTIKQHKPWFHKELSEVVHSFIHQRNMPNRNGYSNSGHAK
jgi:hypothetical protein